MIKRITTLVFAFLTIVGNAVWGQGETTPEEVECAFKVTKTGTEEEATDSTDYVFQIDSLNNDQVLIIKESGLTISNKKSDEATNQWIKIEGANTSKEKPLEITLNGININRTSKNPNVPAIKIVSGNHVKFVLQDENSIATNTEQGTDAQTGVITLEDKDNPSSLTIIGEGTLNITANSGINAIAGSGAVINIESGTIKANSGIGGENSVVTISGGNITINDERGCTACIGNGKSVSISGESTNITLKNPKAGIKAEDIDITKSKIDITYDDNCTTSGTGITYSNSLEMSDCKYVITEERSEVKATGISASAGTAEISNCKMDMLVRDGISIKGSSLSIEKTEININALHYPIVATSTEVLANSYLSLKSTETKGGYPGISGTLKVDGSSYIIADSDSDEKTDTTYGIEDKDRGNWTGIVLESTNIDDFVSGYAYGNVTLGSDFELKENDQLVYSEPTNLEFGQYNIINNGSVCIANEYEDKGIEERIDKGNGTGTYYYEIFFEDDGLEIPYSLQDKMDRNGHTIGDILISMDDKSKATTDLVHRKVHPQNSNQESENMVFGNSQGSIKLGINSDLRNRSNQKIYDKGYTVKSFDVKTKKDGRVIATGVTSFEMPDEAVVIYNLKIEGYKLSYRLADGLKGIEVQFKYSNGKVTTTAAEDDLIWLYITAPGYESFNITKVEYESTDKWSNSILAYQKGQSNDKRKVYVFDSMPGGDVTFVISGEVSEERIPYTVSIGNIQNGTVTASTENGDDATDATTTIYYKDKIVVKATPNTDYELKSLQYKYTIDDKETVVDITDYDQESGTYSFSMPAANVTITAVFGVPTPDEPDDEDKDDDNQGGGTIVKPIKYYNIYIDTICPGLNVELSKDVVQEGHQVSVYLTIQSECDTTGMRFEYKRGLFDWWDDLKVQEGTQPGEYIIKNIYTDIYIRALDATMPDDATGLEEVEGVKAYAQDGNIYVYTPNRMPVWIVSMTGAVLRNEEQVGLHAYDRLTRGIYIVRVGEQVFKIRL